MNYKDEADFGLFKKQILKEMKAAKIKIPSITHYEWKEDGKSYRSHKIDCGSAGTLNCGDAGLELFYKAFIEQGLKTNK